MELVEDPLSRSLLQVDLVSSCLTPPGVQILLVLLVAGWWLCGSPGWLVQTPPKIWKWSRASQ